MARASHYDSRQGRQKMTREWWGPVYLDVPNMTELPHIIPLNKMDGAIDEMQAMAGCIKKSEKVDM